MNINIFTFLWEFFNVLASLSSQLWNFITYDLTEFNINLKMYQLLGGGAIVVILVWGIMKKIIVG